MATSSNTSFKADVAANPSGSNTGYTRDPGPYIGVVMRVVPGSRMGQLEVWIPDFGQPQSDTTNYVSVTYASPFFGTTYGTDSGQLPNSPATSGQSYGFWFVPPDVGNKVLVTFARGDYQNGYWFACILDTPSHHMVPGVGRSIGGSSHTNGADGLNDLLSSDGVYPTVESNSASPTAYSDLVNTPRYVHPAQTVNLIRQGLDRDPIRGAVSSSSMRESPSNCYGISTPGPKATKTVQDPNGNEQKVIYRTGGHQFIMDDGAQGAPNVEDGTDKLIRLRSAGGHQILMNDTEGILYIASASGMQWLEFSKGGAVNVYAYGGFNVRSTGPLNLHSDSSVNIQGNSVKINGTMSVGIESLGSVSMQSVVSASVKTDGSLSLSGLAKANLSSAGKLDVGALGDTSITGAILRLNCSAPNTPLPVIPSIPTFHPDVTLTGKTWSWTPGAVNSICTVVPAHEPWIEPGNNTAVRPKATAGAGLTGAVGTAAAGSIASKTIGAFAGGSS